MIRFSCFALVCGVLSLSACGGDDDGPGPGPMGEDALFDDIVAGVLSCASPITCESFQIDTACTCVNSPSEDTTFATNRVGCSELRTEAGMPRNFDDDFCDEGAASGAPDLGCMMEGMYRVAGTPEMVTVYGVVDVFGNGGDADGIDVEIYEEGTDGNLGAMIGSASSAVTGTECPLAHDPSMPCCESEIEYDNDMEVGMRNLGFYAIPNVPTETALIIKTGGNPSFWRELHTFNILIPNEEIEMGAAGDICTEAPAGPRWEFRARILSRSDYSSIPLTAGLPSGIPNGSGAVAGEIHDCGNVRLEFAQVATNPVPEILTMFNDDPGNPLPDRSRTEGTSLLGLYAALNIPTGPVDVAAVGRLPDGSPVSLGWYRARVFPDSVSVVTFRGLRAHQIP